METLNFEILPAQSNIAWTGRKVTGSHNGTIDIKGGNVVMTDGKLSGGSFVIDTTSIKILDITDAAANAQFAGHLASDDFFSSEKYNTATLDILSATETSTSQYHIHGNLTIKDITHPIDFNASISTVEPLLTASADMIADRTMYNMKFRSGNFFQNLGDTLIYNDFQLRIQLTAKAI
jgi:polyisoprenoid-binding protein YceI